MVNTVVNEGWHFFELAVPIAALAAVCAFVAVLYQPCRKLFFRNDDWYYAGRIEKFIALPLGVWSKVFFIRDIVPGLGAERHFHPLSLLVLALKYKLFRTDYSKHFLVSLWLHLCCFALVFAVIFSLTGSFGAALVAAGMFAMNNMLADTLFWAGQASFILMALLGLGTLICHPFHASGSVVVVIVFFILNALGPLIFEFGFIVLGMNILLFIVPGPLSLLAQVGGCVTLATVALLHLWNRHKRGGLPRHSHFVGPAQLLKNIALGLGKTFLGFAGVRFGIRITDTLYVREAHCGWPLVGLLIIFGLIVQGGGLLWRDVVLLTILTITACMPYVAISFAMDHTNPNPDLAHQLPRYSYLPSCLLAIGLGLILGRGSIHWGWVVLLLVWSAAGNWGGVRKQLAAVKVHTDTLRSLVEQMRDKGLPPPPKSYKGLHDHRLDWMFSPDNIRAFLRIERGG